MVVLYTQTEVTFAIRSLKCNKAPGEDGIPAETYKEINNQLLDLLTSIFNRILISGEYPEVWSEGIICPIYKAEERTDPRNYRGITLLNCIAKIFTAILHTRLSEWAEDNNVRRTIWISKEITYSKSSSVCVFCRFQESI